MPEPDKSSLTPNEVEAVLKVRAGMPIETAAEQTGLTPGRVRAVVDLAASRRAARDVPASIPTPPAARSSAAADTRPGPATARVVQAPAAALPEPQSLEALLAWAESTPINRAVTLAARARVIIGELRTLEKRGERARVARAEVEVLERQLAKAKADLRAATTGKTAGPATPAKAPAKPESGERELIRAWARSNGHNVAERGVIAATVVAAYRAATPAVRADTEEGDL